MNRFGGVDEKVLEFILQAVGVRLKEKVWNHRPRTKCPLILNKVCVVTAACYLKHNIHRAVNKSSNK